MADMVWNIRIIGVVIVALFAVGFISSAIICYFISSSRARLIGNIIVFACCISLEYYGQTTYHSYFYYVKRPIVLFVLIEALSFFVLYSLGALVAYRFLRKDLSSKQDEEG